MRRILAHLYAPANPYLLWLACVLGALLFVLTAAHAHGPAQWIQDGHYRNSAHELCCGERDCGVMIGGSVEQRVTGFEVNADFRVGEGETATIYHVQEFVPNEDATPSPDGSFWRCQWGGQRKCFFYPPPNT